VAVVLGENVLVLLEHVFLRELGDKKKKKKKKKRKERKEKGSELEGKKEEKSHGGRGGSLTKAAFLSSLRKAEREREREAVRKVGGQSQLSRQNFKVSQKKKERCGGTYGEREVELVGFKSILVSKKKKKKRKGKKKKKKKKKREKRRKDLIKTLLLLLLLLLLVHFYFFNGVNL